MINVCLNMCDHVSALNPSRFMVSVCRGSVRHTVQQNAENGQNILDFVSSIAMSVGLCMLRISLGMKSV